MKTITRILLLFLLLPLLSPGQVKLKQKTVKSSDLKITEHFSVLKSDNSIRQGEYLRTKNDKILVKGIYNNGNKEVFQYYDNDGSCFLEYDHGTNTIVSYKEPKNYEYYSDINFKTKADRLALPLFSPFELRLFIANKVRYPIAAQEKGLSGTSEIAINIDESGSATGVSVFKSSHRELDKESLRIMSLLPEDWKWVPALKDGKAVQSFIIVPVHFVLY